METSSVPVPAPTPAQLSGDLDDLIFREDPWLASDR